MRYSFDPADILFGKTKIYSPEMNKLNILLSKTEIKYSVREGVLGGESMDIYDKNGEQKLINVISDGYGREKGLLEAQGLGWDSCGDLTADEIFVRVYEHLR